MYTRNAGSEPCLIAALVSPLLLNSLHVDDVLLPRCRCGGHAPGVLLLDGRVEKGPGHPGDLLGEGGLGSQHRERLWFGMVNRLTTARGHRLLSIAAASDDTISDFALINAAISILCVCSDNQHSH